eukprot:TRINITY_DN1723_c0_g1_i5.p1 TRINITY_DN1723_c0_g1~~TRINITY_DN1723_c0_g1_i5.p1  ORF type:complete len:130 (-),score=13.19 TRINITY_DN1723_c0_g1_i5:34-423(-)
MSLDGVTLKYINDVYWVWASTIMMIPLNLAAVYQLRKPLNYELFKSEKEFTRSKCDWIILAYVFAGVIHYINDLIIKAWLGALFSTSCNTIFTLHHLVSLFLLGLTLLLKHIPGPVSYTHLTLPTIYSV